MVHLGTDLALHLGSELGTDLAGDAGSGISPNAPLGVPGLKAWFDSRDAAYFTFGTGTAVASWVSRAGSLNPISFVQATPASQPLRQASVASFGGRPAVQFDSANDYLVTSNQNAWTFLHNGSGHSVFRVWRMENNAGAAQSVLGNQASLATEVGILHRIQSATQLTHQIANGSGTFLVFGFASDAGGALTAYDVSRWQMWGHATGTSHARASGSNTTLADQVGVPSSAPPSRALVLGASATFGQPFKGYIAQEIYYDHVLTTAELATLAEWAESEYGVEGAVGMPETIPGLKAWFDSRNPAFVTAISGVSAWTSRAGSMGPVALNQATIANRPLYPAALTVFNNLPAIQFDGVDDELRATTAADWTFLHNGSGASVFLVERLDSTGPGTQLTFSTEATGLPSARGVISHNRSTAAGDLNNTLANSGGGLLNNQNITALAHRSLDVTRWRGWSYDGDRVTSYAAGSTISTADSAGVPSQTQPQSPLRLGTTGGGNTPKGQFAQLILYNRVLTQAEWDALGNWASQQYGVVGGVEAPQAVPGLKAWFDSRLESSFVPGAVVAGGTEVVQWNSRAGSIAGLSWVQASTPSRPLRVSSVPTFNNMPAVQFDGVDDSLTTSDQAAWTFLHDGTGYSRFLVWRIDAGAGAAMRFGLTAINSNEVGIQVLSQATSFVKVITNGSGTSVNSWTNSSATHFARDVSRWQMLGYATGAQHSRVSGSSLTNTDLNTPSAAVPARPYRMGTFTNGTQPFKGHIVQEIYYDHVLSTDELALLTAWANALYGVAI